MRPNSYILTALAVFVVLNTPLSLAESPKSQSRVGFSLQVLADYARSPATDISEKSRPIILACWSPFAKDVKADERVDNYFSTFQKNVAGRSNFFSSYFSFIRNVTDEEVGRKVVELKPQVDVFYNNQELRSANGKAVISAPVKTGTLLLRDLVS